MDENNSCKNGWTSEEISENFAVTESSMKVCNNCSNFDYCDGIATCKLDTSTKSVL